MLVIFSLLVLSTFAVEARRVIRAASGSNTTGNYIIVVTDGVNHSRFMEIVDQVKNETLDSKIYEQVEGPFINIISARITADAAHKVSNNHYKIMIILFYFIFYSSRY